MKMGNLEQARPDILKMIDLDPSQRNDAEYLLNQLHAREKEQDQKSKAMFQKFFKWNDTPSPISYKIILLHFFQGLSWYHMNFIVITGHQLQAHFS